MIDKITYTKEHLLSLVKKYKTNILVEVTKNGYIISYRYYGTSFWYIDKKEIKKLIKK
jgi:hypothetical protein